MNQCFKAVGLALAAFLVAFASGLGAITSYDVVTEPNLLLTETDLFLSAVELREGGGHGTGTVGTYKGHLICLTCDHVGRHGAGGGMVAVFHRGLKSSRVSVVYTRYDRAKDLALMEILSWPGDYRLPSFDRLAEVGLGDSVVYSGFPGAERHQLERGLVSNPLCKSFDSWNPQPMFAVTGSGWYGSSGSAVWVNKGGFYRLGGILVQGTGDGHQGVSYCVLPKDIERFLKACYP